MNLKLTTGKSETYSTTYTPLYLKLNFLYKIRVCSSRNLISKMTVSISRNFFIG